MIQTDILDKGYVYLARASNLAIIITFIIAYLALTSNLSLCLVLKQLWPVHAWRLGNEHQNL